MANVHTLGSMRTNNAQRNVPYSPVGNQNDSSGEEREGYPMLDFNFTKSDGTKSTKKEIVMAFFPGFDFKTFTFIISMVQLAVYIFTTILSMTIKEEGGDNCVLYRLGGKYTPAIKVYYHFHRLLLPVFLHANFGHIFFNILSQWLYGFNLEHIYGRKKFIALYFISGVGGNLLSMVKDTQNISVGASSALFGIFALQTIYLIDNYDNLGPKRNVMLIFMVFLLLANFGNASQTEAIDNSAHLGGFMIGGLVGVLYLKRDEDPVWIKRKYLALGVLLLFAIVTLAILPFLSVEAKNLDKFAQYCKNITPLLKY